MSMRCFVKCSIRLDDGVCISAAARWKGTLVPQSVDQTMSAHSTAQQRFTLHIFRAVYDAPFLTKKLQSGFSSYTCYTP